MKSGKPVCTIRNRSGKYVGFICGEPATQYFLAVWTGVQSHTCAMCTKHAPVGDMTLTGYQEITLEEYLVAQVMHA